MENVDFSKYSTEELRAMLENLAPLLTEKQSREVAEQLPWMT